MGLSNKRVAVIGLDGANWDFLNKMIKIGGMPETKKLLNHATKATIKSFPPVTPPAWASITTGVNPGKHGIFGFIHHDVQSGAQKLATTLDLEHPRIYEMLAMQGYNSLVFNPIPAYPIMPMKNLKIASIAFSPKPSFYPSKMSYYAKNFPDYTENLEARRSGKGMDKYLDLKYERTHQRIVTIKKALKNETWDMAWIRLQDPDSLLHIAYDEALSGNSKVKKIMREIDSLVGNIHDRVNLLVIVSDHGLKKFVAEININTILYKNGFINVSFNNNFLESDDVIHKNSIINSNIIVPNIFINLLSNKYLHFYGIIIKNLIKKFFGKELLINYQNVDPLTSDAYLIGRYNYGIIIKNSSYYDHIRNILLKYKGIKEVINKKQIFWGPYVKNAPDLMIYPDYDNGYNLGRNKIYNQIYNYSKNMINHDLYGIMCFIGKDINPINLKNINTWDVAPLIMKYMNVPLPHDHDGKVCKNLFTCELKNNNLCNYNLEWNILKRKYCEHTYIK